MGNGEYTEMERQKLLNKTNAKIAEIEASERKLDTGEDITEKDMLLMQSKATVLERLKLLEDNDASSKNHKQNNESPAPKHKPAPKQQKQQNPSLPKQKPRTPKQPFIAKSPPLKQMNVTPRPQYSPPVQVPSHNEYEEGDSPPKQKKKITFFHVLEETPSPPPAMSNLPSLPQPKQITPRRARQNFNYATAQNPTHPAPSVVTKKKPIVVPAV